MLSADGSKIVFAQFSLDQGEEIAPWDRFDIAVMNTDGSNLYVIPVAPFLSFHPSLSPDASKIVVKMFTSDGSTGGIFVMNVDGSNSTQLTQNLDTYPAFSPDGNQITFTRVAVSDADDTTIIHKIMLINMDGSGERPLITSSVDSFVADSIFVGDRIMFVGTMTGCMEIHSMKLDGTDVKAVTTHTTECHAKAFRMSW